MTMKVWVAAFAAVLLSTGVFAKGTSGSSFHSSSSYGYHAPSISTPKAAPSTPTPAPAAAPSGSAKYGYGKSDPGVGMTVHAPTPPAPKLSGGTTNSDRAIMRQNSSAAAQQYRAQQAQAYAKPAIQYDYRPPVQTVHVYHNYNDYVVVHDRYYGGWSRPPYVVYSAPSFGAWDSTFLWYMAAQSMTNAAMAEWFYDHQTDPGVQAWRAEANRLAADNADLRNQLQAIDRTNVNMTRPPNETNMAGVPTEVAMTADSVVQEDPPADQGVIQSAHHGFWHYMWVAAMLLFGGTLLIFIVRRFV